MKRIFAGTAIAILLVTIGIIWIDEKPAQHPNVVAKMTLGMKKWQWVSTIYGYGTEVKPANANNFTLTFQSNGKFSAGTDCNLVGGRYVVKAEFFRFTDMVSTQMYCANSQERDFIQMLKQTQSYFFNPKGQLVFNLTNNSGSFVFKEMV